MRKRIRVFFAVIVITLMLYFVYPLFLNPKEAKLVFDAPPHHRITSDQNVDFRVIIMTYNRAKSLARCLESLNGIDYLGDKVHVDVWIDRSKKSGRINNETFSAASKFTFQHGTYKVNRHPKHVGLFGQWLTTWSPREDTREIAILVEDDITLSKHVYRWLKMVHKKYDSLPYINGFSTQGKSTRHGINAGRGALHGPETEVVFSYPVLGSWGFSPKLPNWLKFISWYNKANLNRTFIPSVPGSKVTKWFNAEARHGRTDRIWTIWHACYAYKNHELTIYPNFPGKKGLAINWMEPGLHANGKSKLVNNDPIVIDWDTRYEDLPTEPVQLNDNAEVVKDAVRSKL